MKMFRALKSNNSSKMQIVLHLALVIVKINLILSDIQTLR